MELDIAPARPTRMPIATATPIGAIDAGSSALRAAVALASPGAPPRIVNRIRLPVRLGHDVFIRAALASDAVERAVDAFTRFRAMFDSYGVRQIRAVGTSALREASDRATLIDAVHRATAIRLEPIDAGEEARLVRTAVLAVFPREAQPELIADLGGGSLEISVLYRGGLVTSVALPLGTVRLLETLELDHPLDAAAVARLRALVLAELRRALPRPPDRTTSIALCGGNAKTLARLFPGAPPTATPSLDVTSLAHALPAMCGQDVSQRMATYQVGRDRAEVMAVAAVVIATLAEWLGRPELAVPGVGVLDGLLLELAPAAQILSPRL